MHSLLQTSPTKMTPATNRPPFGRVAAACIAIALGTRTPLSAQDNPVDPQADIESLFEDFLHYSVLGRFDLAETYAETLLARPDLDPVELLHLSEANKQSVATLLVLIEHSTISDSASRVLEKIHEGEHLQRQNDQRILTNIEKLGGPPQMEHNATLRLEDSGEYAIPWMIQTLRDRDRKALWPRVIRALPKIGKPAVNPLVEALAASDDTLTSTVIDALGNLGYAQAVPYLAAVVLDPDASPERRAAAEVAISRIRARGGPGADGSPADEFVRLATQFYDEHGSVQADPRLPQANVWYWNHTNQFLDAVAVPREIFGPVMAMRCCERALMIDPGHADAVALWLAANIRREARLGMNVESGDPTETGTVDPTRPAQFPRALYFTSAAGPRYAHLALGRAVSDADAPVALGTIAGLRQVAGASSLLGTEDYKQAFVAALRFPDLVVRIRTALALGNALPRDAFLGSELVIGILSDALLQTGRRNILVVDDDSDNLSRVMNELRDADTNVIGATTVLDGVERAEREFAGLFSAIFMSTSTVESSPTGAIAAIRERAEIAATPIVLLVQTEHQPIVSTIVGADPGVEPVPSGANRDELAQALATVVARVGQTPLTPDLALQMSLRAARTLERIALDGRTTFDPGAAERALTQSAAADNEELRIASIQVLALLPSSTAQQAIAAITLDASEGESMRIPAFASLAESARRFGSGLESTQVDGLLNIAMNEPNLRLRTAASQALGALNLAPEKANQTILKYHRG